MERPPDKKGDSAPRVTPGHEQANEPSVFISYSWADKAYVEKIEAAFRPKERKSLVRDVRDAKNYSSIKSFMKRIRESDYVILLVSDTYLKSKNCMYEILELLKNDNYRSRIFPVIVKDSGLDIYSDSAIPKYVAYWRLRYDQIRSESRGLRPEQKVEVDDTLRIIGSIRASIGQFVSALQDLKSPSLEELAATQFRSIRQVVWQNDGEFDRALLDRCLADFPEYQISTALNRHKSDDALTFGLWLLEHIWKPVSPLGGVPIMNDKRHHEFRLCIDVAVEIGAPTPVTTQICDEIKQSYLHLAIALSEAKDNKKHYGYYVLEDPAFEEIEKNNIDLMNVLNKSHLLAQRIFSPAVFLECCRHLAPEYCMKDALERYMDTECCQFGEWLLGQLKPLNRFTRAKTRQGALDILRALIIRETGRLTTTAREVRDELIQAVQDGFEYDWEYNDAVQLSKRALINALVIIDDERSLEALNKRFPKETSPHHETDWDGKIKKIALKCDALVLKVDHLFW